MQREIEGYLVPVAASEALADLCDLFDGELGAVHRRNWTPSDRGVVELGHASAASPSGRQTEYY
jgi:hypothetical protein